MKIRNLAVALTLLFAVSGTDVHALENISQDGCVTRWSTCRTQATTAYFNNQVGMVRYSLLLDGCDMGYGACAMMGL
jgi:hypothetical protein